MNDLRKFLFASQAGKSETHRREGIDANDFFFPTRRNGGELSAIKRHVSLTD